MIYTSRAGAGPVWWVRALYW